MTNAPASSLTADPRDRFEALANEWEAATRFLSSVHQISMQSAYQRIIGMGPAAVPLILERMASRRGHWFWALEAITGEDPVLPEHAGDIQAMTNDWLGWANQRRILGGRG